MKDKGFWGKYFSYMAATVIYLVGCICGVYVAYIQYSQNLSLFERIANGIGYPISYGGSFVIIYFFLSIVLSYIIENHFSNKTVVIIVTFIAIAAGLSVSLLR